VNALESWVDELATALGVDPAEVDVTRLLDVARDAAHSVARPAAPLTTYLVGLATGLRGGGQAELETAAATAQRLAQQHAS
jgi:CO/xanthine dehydrogenase Mo-binding subunit